MEISMWVVHVIGFTLLLPWLVIEFFRQRSVEDKQTIITHRKNSSTSNQISVISNVLITVSYLGFCFYEVWKLNHVSTESVFKAISWILVSVFVFYSKDRVLLGENQRWPLVLIVWWGFSSILNAFSNCIYLLTTFQSIRYPDFFLQTTNFADFATFPLIAFLCFNALHFNYTKKLHEIEHPLLQEEGKEEEDDVSGNVDAFSNAGIWSHLTFRWLNPLFVKGRTHKLEPDHIPSVPESEKAKKAYSLLHESLSAENPSLPPIFSPCLS